MKVKILQSIQMVLWIGLSSALSAQQPGELYAYIPDTVSDEAKAILALFPDPNQRPALPEPDAIEAWTAFQESREVFALNRQQGLIESLQPVVTEMTLNGVPVLDIRPRGWKDNGKLMVYTHGGGYVSLSARSSLASSALMAETTGLRVISVDYTLAPHAQWQQITDQVVSVFKALTELGYAMSDMAIYGDSAGGGLAAGSVLKMRDLGMGMPAAVVLWSPMSDITDTGDSFATLKHAEPFYIYDKHLRPAANAYADPKDHKHPYVSPVYADYSKGFPPTLIQGGTREIFLSNFVRHYRALDTAGQLVTLDIYEGMVHVFQVHLAGSPESKTALAKVAAFLEKHLRD